MYLGYKDITISYAKNIILDNVSLSFEKGKITSIIGRNGTGKSSLLKVLSKTIKPKTGYCILENKRLEEYKSNELAKKIAILPQIHDFIPSIDVYTLVSFGRFPHRSKKQFLSKEDKNIIDETLEITNLTKLRNKTLSTLSGGERQRAWIAMIVSQKTDIIVLDEPTTYLDINFQLEILELLKMLNEKFNITIVMVLHDLNMVSRYSHFIYTIKDKKIYKKGNSNEIVSEELIKDVFKVDSQIQIDKKNNCPYFIAHKTIEKEK